MSRRGWVSFRCRKTTTGEKIRVTYHDPCHLVRAQGVSEAPRKILKALPQVEYVEMEEANTCCGGGGSFQFDFPEVSKGVTEKKIARIRETGAGVVATGCPGCRVTIGGNMGKQDRIAVLHENEYLLAKILSLTTIKGLENDLRFLFEQSFFAHMNKVPETEAMNRTDLRLPLEQILLIEMKCYDGVLTTSDTQKKIKKDFATLSKDKSASNKLFIYFGLYGKRQAPACKAAYIPSNRVAEIKSEIEKIHGIAKNQGVEISGHEYYDKTLSDRILYCAWFHLK